MTADTARRSRPVALLTLGQVRYQLLLVLRSPLGFFLTIVVPLLLLVTLNVITPGTGGEPGVVYAQFLTPAMSAFSLLTACYVTTITAVVLAREEGVLKRLRGTPLPAWAYLAGRAGSALVMSIVSVAIIVGTGAVFFGVTVVWPALGYFAAASVLGIVCFYLLGVAVTAVVPKTEAALPVAFGTMLPLAFISDVFFASGQAPGWLSSLASALPVAPVVKAMEKSFVPGTSGWPMPAGELGAVLAWTAGAALVVLLAFRWEPGPAGWRRRWRRPH